MRMLLALLCAVCLPAMAQTGGIPNDPSEIAFRQALKDMSNDLRLMCVAAHPDDEDGATLAYYRYKHGVKTYALIGTRGEGGQNEIGPELYEDLAVIRTKEMMAAAEIEGAELHFLDMPEFGFSKTIDETFEKWGKDVLLEKMVRKIREIRPHVIITHHGRMKDHGHHQAIGWAVQEAFTVAADSAAFPDAGDPWQVQRLFIRDFSQQSTEAVVIDISETDELRGKKYTEIAADALRAHKSQGMEQFINMLLTGEPKAYYDLVKSAEVANNHVVNDEVSRLFRGVSHTIALSDFKAEDRSREEWKDFADREIERLSKLRGSCEHSEIQDYGAPLWFANCVAAQAAEVSVTGQFIDAVIVPGQSYDLQIEIEDGGKPDGDHGSLALWTAGGWCGNSDTSASFVLNDEGHAESHLRFGYNTLTIPPARHLFDNAFFAPNILVNMGLAQGRSKGTAVHVSSSFHVDVAPPVLPEFLDAPYLLRPLGTQGVQARVRLTNYTPGPHAQEVRFTAPEGWAIALGGPNGEARPSGPSTPSNTLAFNAEFTKEDEQRTVELTLTPPEAFTPGSYTLTAETEGLDFTPEAKVQIAELTVIPSDVLGRADPEDKLRPIGLIDSYDTTFRDTMTKLGRPHERIGEHDFTPESLDRFHLILVDMRSYLYRPDLKANNAVLLDWCKRGGTLIVNYHKTFDWSPDFAPYPISLSSNRVTREDAPVKLLVPEHPWFNHPNKITPEDWDGWRQERGLYFAGKWDDAYTPLIDTSDPGETIPPGSCLIADYGEGTYFYTSLVWYRQLRELHPGALKLFANMLML